MTRLFERLNGTRYYLGQRWEAESPRSAARFYGFRRTAKLLGDVPVTVEGFAEMMKPWTDAILRVMNEDRESPLLALVRKAGTRSDAVIQPIDYETHARAPLVRK